MTEEVTVRGYASDKDALQRRLRRIEGQVRGLQRMLADDAYCIDVLTQISAMTRALDAVGLNLLESHMQHCLHDALGGRPAGRYREGDRGRRSSASPGPLLADRDLRR